MMVKFTCAASIMDKRTTENIRLTVALANTEYVVSLASMGDNVAFVFATLAILSRHLYNYISDVSDYVQWLSFIT